MLQIVFSYDTLVESNQLFDELDNKNDDKNNNNNHNNNDSSDEDDDDGEEDEDNSHNHNHRNGSNIKTKKKNKISSSSNGLNVMNQDSISGKSNGGEDTINEISNEKTIFLNGFYGSATEILGLNEEIYNVAKSYKIQKNINQMEENDQKRRGAGRDWKRRVGPNQGYMILHYIFYETFS